VVGLALAQALEAFGSCVDLGKDLRESRQGQKTTLNTVRHQWSTAGHDKRTITP
jgi:hypothetical protein